MENDSYINAIFELFQKHNRAPQTELYYVNGYTLLVAVVLSARATDKSVNLVTRSLFQEIKTPKEMVLKGIDFLNQRIQSIGLYQAKGNYIINLSKILIEKHDDEVPRQREDLEALPGVGRKTADVVLNALFDEPTIAVDTHVFRVSNRLHLSHGKTVLKVREDLLRRIPQKYVKNAHHWLILHGRYTCTAFNPKCSACFLAHLCPSARNPQKSA